MHSRSESRRLLGRWSDESRITSLLEIVTVFGIGASIIGVGLPFAGENPLARQGVVWIGYVVMLAAVWLDLRLRGESWSAVGLGRTRFDRGTVWRLIWQSVTLLAAVLVAYVAAAILMANITGIPEQADLSKYNYLRGNLPLLLLALVGVWLVSSLGEEILFRGFLITRLAELGNRSHAAWRLAVVASSIFFGIVHYEWGPMGVVQTGFMGLALGIAFLVLRRNLWVLVLTHFYMDTILLVQLYFAPAA